jgi:hypothetical protein
VIPITNPSLGRFPRWDQQGRKHNCCSAVSGPLCSIFPQVGMKVSALGPKTYDQICLHRPPQCRRSIGEVSIHRLVLHLGLFTFFLAATAAGFAQSEYKVVTVTNGGTISGTVKWSGPIPRGMDFPVTKDPQICDPDSRKTVDLERLIVGPQGGVANAIVYLKNISAGKALKLPEQRRHLDQQHCRYIPHVLLVPENAELSMQSSDATLHTIHMDGAASFNLPFPFVNKVSSRTMSAPGLVHLRCNGGHVWMNAEMMVVPHPYYAVTDESGRFELVDVPPGNYQIVAWHEGWGLAGKQQAYDVLTERTVQRPVFTEPKSWEKQVTVNANQPSVVNFVISSK